MIKLSFIKFYSQKILGFFSITISCKQLSITVFAEFFFGCTSLDNGHPKPMWMSNRTPYVQENKTEIDKLDGSLNLR